MRVRREHMPSAHVVPSASIAHHPTGSSPSPGRRPWLCLEDVGTQVCVCFQSLPLSQTTSKGPLSSDIPRFQGLDGSGLKSLLGRAQACDLSEPPFLHLQNGSNHAHLAEFLRSFNDLQQAWHRAHVPWCPFPAHTLNAVPGASRGDQVPPPPQQTLPSPPPRCPAPPNSSRSSCGSLDLT